jgi:sialate O-acetylesterase
MTYHSRIAIVLALAGQVVVCWLAFGGWACAEAPARGAGLLEVSFEDVAGAGKDEALVPGCRVKFRGNGTEPGLDSAELAVVDDPAQSHSGRRCVRLSPQRRVVGLEYSGEPSRSLSPGLYEMSAWVRGRPGTKLFFGSYSLGPAGNFWLTSDRWRRIRLTTWLKDGRPFAGGNIVHVWPEGEREQPKDPLVFFDDASIVRLTSGLADVFGDHMVLQRDKKLPVWGWTENPGQTVTVKLVGQTRTATSGPDGRWSVSFDPIPAGGPHVIELDGRVAAYDVMLGDVWICSGQSNMEMGVDKLRGEYTSAPEVIAAANHPRIRLWHASKQFSAEPARAYVLRQNGPVPHQAAWNPCGPDTVILGGWGGFSAVGYYFGVEIEKSQKVAIGLMELAHGGSAIEAWMSAEALAKIPRDRWVIPPLSEMAEAKVATASLPPLPEAAKPASTAFAEVVRTANGEPPKAGFNFATAAFNGIVAPVFPFAVRGVLWYQGEHNSADPHYEAKLAALIADWRARAGDPNLPSLVTQLCNWDTAYVKDYVHDFATVREAQRRVTETVPGTALAVTIDLADKPGEGGHGNDGMGPKSIHPIHKREVGERNALAARQMVYGERVVGSGPRYKSSKVEGGRLRVAFDSVGGGLVARGDKLVGFTVAGADGRFVPAEAVIDGNTVVLTAASVPAPVAARYGYAQFVAPVCNLANREGLPASPFRTD